MNYSRLNQSAREMIIRSYRAAQNEGLACLEPSFLGLYLMDNEPLMTLGVLRRSHISPDVLRRVLQEEISALPHGMGGGLSLALDRTLEAAHQQNPADSIAPEHIFRAIVEERRDACREASAARPQPESGRSGRRPEEQGDRESGFLERYARNLMTDAQQGKLEPVVGREAEIRQTMYILARKHKSPILVGKTGVGKTAIVEGLAMKIAAGDVPGKLQGKTIWSLDMGALMAGTRFQGELENRLKGIVREVTESEGRYLLFMDEIHLLIGAGRTSGALDASNLLKPALARGEIKLIGATTEDEYVRYVESDKAFERRFRKVFVDELSAEDTLTVLQGIRSHYEEYYGLTMNDETLELAVKLSGRFLPERYQPDKAIDLMDETAARVSLDGGAEVLPDDICRTLTVQTGIPVSRLRQDELESLRDLETVLAQKVIGQQEAVHQVAAALRRARMDFSDATRPQGCFLFTGPTGVGKTELAKVLAEIHSGSRDKLVRIDMSEYQERHTVSRLIGAPPGYVGYENRGQLTEAVRRHSYCVILLDEVEKAHPDVFNAFLQVLDDGRMTDGQGVTVDFKNTIIIMTSNAGVREAERASSRIGYEQAGSEDAESAIRKAVRRLFAPEFINRLDGVVNFNRLGREELVRIARMKLDEQCLKFAEKGYEVHIGEGVAELLAEKDADPAMGARPINRAVKKYIADPFVERVLRGEALPGSVTDITVEQEQIIMTSHVVSE